VLACSEILVVISSLLINFRFMGVMGAGGSFFWELNKSPYVARSQVRAGLRYRR
jgi:hypothetical protein